MTLKKSPWGENPTGWMLRKKKTWQEMVEEQKDRDPVRLALGYLAKALEYGLSYEQAVEASAWEAAQETWCDYEDVKRLVIKEIEG
jgi:hypothetical protein